MLDCRTKPAIRPAHSDNPLDVLLTAAVTQADDKTVRAWLERLLRSNEAASSDQQTKATPAGVAK